ncbi:hypothetical protein J6590_005304 [Homalodisca vitripennis]|nr:hypothetical protein J6590_005304 [Homalodisca vitripennis]
MTQPSVNTCSPYNSEILSQVLKLISVPRSKRAHRLMTTLIVLPGVVGMIARPFFNITAPCYTVLCENFQLYILLTTLLACLRHHSPQVSLPAYNDTWTNFQHHRAMLHRAVRKLPAILLTTLLACLRHHSPQVSLPAYNDTWTNFQHHRAMLHRAVRKLPAILLTTLLACLRHHSPQVSLPAYNDTWTNFQHHRAMLHRAVRKLPAILLTTLLACLRHHSPQVSLSAYNDTWTIFQHHCAMLHRAVRKLPDILLTTTLPRQLPSSLTTENTELRLTACSTVAPHTLKATRRQTTGGFEEFRIFNLVLLFLEAWLQTEYMIF